MRRDGWKWFGWKVVFPLAIIGATGPVYEYVMEINLAFERAYATGDLLIFAALLLLESALEEKGFGKRGFWRAFREGGRVFGVFVMFIFGFLKYDSVKLQGALQGIDEEGLKHVAGKLYNYAVFSWSVACVAVVYSIVAFWIQETNRAKEFIWTVGGEN